MLWSRLRYLPKLPYSRSPSLCSPFLSLPVPFLNLWPKSQQWAHLSLQEKRDGQEDEVSPPVPPVPQSPQTLPAQSLLPASQPSTAPLHPPLPASEQNKKTSTIPQTIPTRPAQMVHPTASPLSSRTATGVLSARAKRKKNPCLTSPLIQS
jgi:hypothetical protein